MPIPKAVTQFNKRYLNRLTVHLAGHGSFVELEHTGRRSGTLYHTTLMGFREGTHVTIALTYGSDVDWLKNVDAAGGGRMHIGPSVVDLGSPVHLPAGAGLQRMPWGPRLILPVIKVDQFIQMPILSERAFTGWSD